MFTEKEDKKKRDADMQSRCIYCDPHHHIIFDRIDDFCVLLSSPGPSKTKGLVNLPDFLPNSCVGAIGSPLMMRCEIDGDRMTVIRR